MHVGMANVPEAQWNSVFSQHMQTRTDLQLLMGWEQMQIKKDVEPVRPWESLNLQGNSKNILVRLPVSWILFFNKMLLSADNFDWAKKFLASGASAHLMDNSGMLSLPIPKIYPESATSTLGIDLIDDTNAESAKESGLNLQEALDAVYAAPTIEMDTTRKRKATKKSTPMVESQVHRSERVKQGSNGFKISNCTSKKCTSCNPPILSNKVIRTLGTQFCSMDPELLDDEAWEKGGGLKEPVVKKKSKVTKANKGARKHQTDGKDEDGNGHADP